MVRRLALALSVLGLTAAFATAAMAAGGGATVVRDAVIWADGDRYRTVLTPNDLSHTGAPDHSFDTLYMFGDAQGPLSDATPGSAGYNGGRWIVRPLSFPHGYAAAAGAFAGADGVFDRASELHAAVAAGAAVVGAEVRRFSCPLQRVR